MPLFLLFLAALLAVSAWDNQLQYLFTLVQEDVANTAFLSAFALLVILSLAAEDDTLQRPAMLLGALVILALFLKAGTGTFSQIANAFSNPTAPGSEANPAAPSGNPTVTVDLGSGANSALSGIGSAISGVGSVVSGITSIF